MLDSELRWEMFLRGAVAAVLVFHVLNLALPGARPAARAALALFTLSVLAYLFCQQSDVLLGLPLPAALAVLALCVSSAAWMWVAARALFHDGFSFSIPVVAAAVAMVALGMAANVPYLVDAARHVAVAFDSPLSRLHAAAMLGFAAAALWEVARGWREDLVEPRRVARRWVAMGIGLYAALALVIELAVRGHPIGRLLPALHVAGIGFVTLALAVFVARRSLDEVLGMVDPSAPAPAPEPAPEPAPGAPLPRAVDAEPSRESKALARLEHGMTEERLYRREGLTLAGLAQLLGVGETTLRAVINQRLGYRNFNDFLHHYRVQEAAARLAHEDLPILTIALECGYGSIGPFNRAFRERMRMTPSEYRGASRLYGGVAMN
jgi:AraC-like DNA-binding protein